MRRSVGSAGRDQEDPRGTSKADMDEEAGVDAEPIAGLTVDKGVGAEAATGSETRRRGGAAFLDDEKDEEESRGDSAGRQ